LIRFLVERMGFTAIALESGFTESISARPFIERGDGDAETATLTGLGRGLARYPQSRELIQWMRDYNATAASAGHRRIRLYGFDIPNGGRRDGPWLAMDSALTFLARADPTAANKIRASLGDSLSGLDASQFGPTRRSIGANVSSQGLITLSTAVDAFVFVNTLTPAVSN
jgi:erythromycin esterase